MKSFKDRLSEVKTTRWIRFAAVSLLFFLFVIWIGNPWLLLVWPLLADIYITGYIPFTVEEVEVQAHAGGQLDGWTPSSTRWSSST